MKWRAQSLEAVRADSGESPYQVQHDLQDMMQDLVGIVRREDEMEQALEGIAKLKERAAKVGIGGNREYNPGWHTALDLNNLLTVSEAIALAATGAQGKPRRAFPRRLSGEGPGLRDVQFRHQQGRGRRDAASSASRCRP